MVSLKNVYYFRCLKWTSVAQKVKVTPKAEQFASFGATEEAHWGLIMEAADQVFLSPTEPSNSCFFPTKYTLLGNIGMTSAQE